MKTERPETIFKLPMLHKPRSSEATLAVLLDKAQISHKDIEKGGNKPGLFHSHEGPNMLRFQAISSR
jgi:hypothetical protein